MMVKIEMLYDGAFHGTSYRIDMKTYPQIWEPPFCFDSSWWWMTSAIEVKDNDLR